MLGMQSRAFTFKSCIVHKVAPTLSWCFPQPFTLVLHMDGVHWICTLSKQLQFVYHIDSNMGLYLEHQPIVQPAGAFPGLVKLTYSASLANAHSIVCSYIHTRDHNMVLSTRVWAGSPAL